MRAHYELAGTIIEVRWEGATLGPAVRAVFEHLGTERIHPNGAEPHVTITASVAGAAPSVPERAEHVTTFDVGLTACRDGAHLFLQSPPAMDRRAVARLDPAAGVARLEVAPRAPEEEAADPQALAGALFGMLAASLFVLLRPRQRYPLHAAALAREEAGVLLVANRDGGKSTLAYSLARQGWSFLSDDSVLLRRVGAGAEEQVEAVAFRRRFTMDAEAQALFPEIKPHWNPLFGSEAKGAVSMHDLYPGQAAERCVPRVLVFPEIADRPDSRLFPLGKAEAMHRVLGQSAMVTLQPALAPQHVEVARRLVRQTRHYRLLGGRDVKDDPARAARLLEQTLRREAPATPVTG